MIESGVSQSFAKQARIGFVSPSHRPLGLVAALHPPLRVPLSIYDASALLLKLVRSSVDLPRKQIDFLGCLVQKRVNLSCGNSTDNAAAQGTQRSKRCRSLFEVCKIYTLSLKIDWTPLSLNKALRKGWRGRHALNTAWDNQIAALVYRKKPSQPLARARITIVRHAHRKLDFDGLVGSLKPVVDALVSAGIVVDDSWDRVGPWTVDQKFRPKGDGQLLEIHIAEIS